MRYILFCLLFSQSVLAADLKIVKMTAYLNLLCPDGAPSEVTQGGFSPHNILEIATSGPVPLITFTDNDKRLSYSIDRNGDFVLIKKKSYWDFWGDDTSIIAGRVVTVGACDPTIGRSFNSQFLTVRLNPHVSVTASVKFRGRCIIRNDSPHSGAEYFHSVTEYLTVADHESFDSFVVSQKDDIQMADLESCQTAGN